MIVLDGDKGITANLFSLPSGLSILTGNTTSVTNGSTLIGNTVSGGFDATTITQGTGITVTNEKGSIVVAAKGPRK